MPDNTGEHARFGQFRLLARPWTLVRPSHQLDLLGAGIDQTLAALKCRTHYFQYVENMKTFDFISWCES
jgi:hypothetical protein